MIASALHNDSSNIRKHSLQADVVFLELVSATDVARHIALLDVVFRICCSIKHRVFHLRQSDLIAIGHAHLRRIALH